jgi:hypothetical protein
MKGICHKLPMVGPQGTPESFGGLYSSLRKSTSEKVQNKVVVIVLVIIFLAPGTLKN